MIDKKAKYITTTLPYVNADPHIGFGLEVLQADTLARYWRLMGHEVFFNTGTDEHGQKIAQKADEKGEDRQAYVDHYAAEFDKLKSALNLSYDNFIRTTNPDHQAAAQEMWQRCAGKDDIYKKKYTGLYCVGCELYYKESELDENKCCLIHGTPAEEVEEENYFFKLSNYQAYLEEYLSKEGVIVPEWRRQEAINFVKGGLEDFSISREKSRMDWGVPVPGDDDQVMYVWFDALTNYISTLGWPSTLSSASTSETEEGKPKEDLFQKFWVDGETLQMAGKDQVRFQSIMWQAMLKSAGIKATDKVFYHGFITSGGQKMSKSIGNVISPYEMVERYGTEATRYILLRHVHPTDDSDITWERMDEWYTANLVNGIGNLTARIMKMAEMHLEEAVVCTNEFGVESESLDKFNFQQAMDSIWKNIGYSDDFIQREQPFKIIKEDKEKGVEIIKKMVEQLHLVAIELQPYMPDTAGVILGAIKKNKKPENLFVRLNSDN